MRVTADIRVALLCLIVAMLFAPATAFADEKASGWKDAAKPDLALNDTGRAVVEGALGLSEVACNDCQWNETKKVTDKELKKEMEWASGYLTYTYDYSRLFGEGGAEGAPSESFGSGGMVNLKGRLAFHPMGTTNGSYLMEPMTRTAITSTEDPLGQALDILLSPDPSADAQAGGAGHWGLTDSGISFGGPIIKDKLWFFGTYRQPPIPDKEPAVLYRDYFKASSGTASDGFGGLKLRYQFFGFGPSSFVDDDPGGMDDAPDADVRSPGSLSDGMKYIPPPVFGTPFGYPPYPPCNDTIRGGDAIKISYIPSMNYSDYLANWYDDDSPFYAPTKSEPDVWTTISPRISLTYDITGDGKNVVRGNNFFQMGTRMTFGGEPAPPTTAEPIFYGGTSKTFLEMFNHLDEFGTPPGTGSGLDGLSLATPGGYLGGALGFPESGPRLGGPIIKDKLWFFGSRPDATETTKPSGTPAVSDRLPTFWMLNLGLEKTLKQPRQGEPQCTGAAVLVDSPDGLCPWQPGAVPWIDPFRKKYNGRTNVDLDDILSDLRTYDGVIFAEGVCIRFKLETPNDEYYLNVEAMKEKEKKKKKKKAKSILGFGLKLLKSAQEGTVSVGGYDEEADATVMNQWSLMRVGYKPINEEDVPSAWNVTTGVENPVVVAVIDSGLDFNHPDFSLENVWINEGEVPGNLLDDDGNGYVDDVVGWNFIDWNNAPFDDDGHGTIVSGIIAAKTNNGEGIAGINWGAKIMPLKVSNAEGISNSFNVAKAIIYAADNGARVINLSLGGGKVTALEQMAVDYANAKGAIVVVASGNEAIDIADYSPAALRGVITVGGTDFDDMPIEEYNFGQNVFVAAPAKRVFSLRARNTSSLGKGLITLYSFGTDRRYYIASGTSFSTPIVAGTISLMLSMDPSLTLDEVRWKLMQGVLNNSKSAWDAHIGFGRINAIEALKAEPDDGMLLAWVERPEVYKDKVLLFGSARAANFKGYTVEIGKGKRPSSWTTVQESDEQTSSGVIGIADAKKILKSKQWTVRLKVSTEDGEKSEARYTFRSKDLKQ